MQMPKCAEMTVGLSWGSASVTWCESKLNGEMHILNFGGGSLYWRKKRRLAAGPKSGERESFKLASSRKLQRVSRRRTFTFNN
jgi:hypothetical protein